MVEFTATDRRIIAEMQGDLPLDPRPYAAVAARVGLGEEELLERLREFLRRGWLRRVGAILYHERAGIKANVMCAWRVPPERLEEAGRAAASCSGVSHCYQRPAYPQWPYNLYTMVHGRTEKECQRVVRELADLLQPEDYALLSTTREFKKTSMRYVQK